MTTKQLLSEYVGAPSLEPANKNIVLNETTNNEKKKKEKLEDDKV